MSVTRALTSAAGANRRVSGPHHLSGSRHGGLLTVPCLFALRQRPLDEGSRALWALVIVSAPMMGALAFVLLRPGTRA
jgi:hypothetical protein